ncbi:hypothetical protein ACUNE6_27690 [Serratia sp. IR-2025]
MKKINLEVSFFIAVFVVIFFVMSAFFTWNKDKPDSLPETKGALSNWAIDKCEIKSSAIYVSGWAFIHGTMKFDNLVYIKISGSNKYVRVSSQAYQRKQETPEMISRDYIDNSGFVAAKRLTSTSIKFDPIITIISLGPNGLYYRGDYACK